MPKELAMAHLMPEWRPSCCVDSECSARIAARKALECTRQHKSNAAERPRRYPSRGDGEVLPGSVTDSLAFLQSSQVAKSDGERRDSGCVGTQACGLLSHMLHPS